MGIFGNAFGWPHLIIILAVILLIFGATRLPALAKSVGQSAKIFRNEIKKDDEPEGKADAVATEAPKATTPAAASETTSSSDGTSAK